jgi:hypothetical protein
VGGPNVLPRGRVLTPAGQAPLSYARLWSSTSWCC